MRSIAHTIAALSLVLVLLTCARPSAAQDAGAVEVFERSEEVESPFVRPDAESGMSDHYSTDGVQAPADRLKDLVIITPDEESLHRARGVTLRAGLPATDSDTATSTSAGSSESTPADIRWRIWAEEVEGRAVVDPIEREFTGARIRVDFRPGIYRAELIDSGTERREVRFGVVWLVQTRPSDALPYPTEYYANSTGRLPFGIVVWGPSDMRVVEVGTTLVSYNSDSGERVHGLLAKTDPHMAPPVNINGHRHAAVIPNAAFRDTGDYLFDLDIEVSVALSWGGTALHLSDSLPPRITVRGVELEVVEALVNEPQEPQEHLSWAPEHELIKRTATRETYASERVERDGRPATVIRKDDGDGGHMNLIARRPSPSGGRIVPGRTTELHAEVQAIGDAVGGDKCEGRRGYAVVNDESRHQYFLVIGYKLTDPYAAGEGHHVSAFAASGVYDTNASVGEHSAVVTLLRGMGEVREQVHSSSSRRYVRFNGSNPNTRLWNAAAGLTGISNRWLPELNVEPDGTVSISVLGFTASSGADFFTHALPAQSDDYATAGVYAAVYRRGSTLPLEYERLDPRIQREEDEYSGEYVSEQVTLPLYRDYYVSWYAHAMATAAYLDGTDKFERARISWNEPDVAGFELIWTGGTQRAAPRRAGGGTPPRRPGGRFERRGR